jgi:SAM-dependent methyltransferase
MALPSITYKAFAHYYDLYVGNFSADLDFYLSLCTSDDSILEVGCGTGRVLQKFLQNNFQVTGIDISNEMLDIAKEKLNTDIKQKKLKLVNHNLSNASMPVRFDKALVTFYTFNYITKQPEIFLKNLYESLNTDGIAVFDLFYPKVLADPSINDIWTESSINLDHRKILIRDKRKFEINREFRSQVYIENGKEIQIDSERRYFSPQEIGRLLKHTGFKKINFSNRYSKETFTDSIDEKMIKTNFIVKAEK